MTVEPISNRQTSTPLKAVAAGAGVAALATAGLVAGQKSDVFNKVSQKITGDGKAQTYAKKALDFLQKSTKKFAEKAKPALGLLKKVAGKVIGVLGTAADRVIKFVSGSLDKVEAKISPDKFAKGAVALDEQLAEKFGNIATKF